MKIYSYASNMDLHTILLPNVPHILAVRQATERLLNFALFAKIKKEMLCSMLLQQYANNSRVCYITHTHGLLSRQSFPYTDS